jgi:TetR/AcrR family transcriptional regulator, mexJK operon transcriptional repressor
VSQGVVAKPVEEAESKRERIIRLAGALFLDRGYDAVSINDIIEVAGGSKGTIYSNFGSKEKLFEAVVEKMCHDVTIKIDTRSSGTLTEQLTRIGQSFVSMVISEPILQFHRLMTSIGRAFPEAGRLFYETGPRTAQGIIAAWIDHQQTMGNLRGDADPFRLAVLFHDMLIGEQMLIWLTSAVDESERVRRVDDTVALAVRVFLQGAGAERI